MDAKKQTALKHFLMGIYDLNIIKLDDNDKINQLSDLYHECLAMEKEQIEKAYNESWRLRDKPYLTALQYYNETYNK
jgi:hypothetical protein